MTNTLITIQNATSNGIIDRYSSSSDFWSNVADFSALMVGIGVLAEILELTPKILKAGVELNWCCIVKRKAKIEHLLAWFKKREHWIDVWGFIFWIVIVLSLAGELMGTRIARHFDSLTIGLLNNESARLVKEGQSFRLRADELESEIQPRIITTKQTKLILERLRNVPRKCRVVISYNQPDLETAVFAMRLRDIINGCRYDWHIESTFLTFEGMPPPTGVSLQARNPTPYGAQELANAFADAGVFPTNTISLDAAFEPNLIKISVWLKPLPHINPNTP